MSTDIDAWLERHQGQALVQLEMPPPIAVVVARLLEDSGFEMQPMHVNDWATPRAIVVPKPHLVDALVLASTIFGQAAEEALKDCPECQQGKHDNCPGDTWDDRPGHDELATCPCYARGHRLHRDEINQEIAAALAQLDGSTPAAVSLLTGMSATSEEVLETDVWPDDETLRRLTDFSRHPLTEFPPGADTPLSVDRPSRGVWLQVVDEVDGLRDAANVLALVSAYGQVCYDEGRRDEREDRTRRR